MTDRKTDTTSAAQEICAQNNAPKLGYPDQARRCRVEEKRKNWRDRVFGEKLHVTKNDDQKTDRVAKVRDSEPPFRLGQDGYQDPLAQHGCADG